MISSSFGLNAAIFASHSGDGFAENLQKTVKKERPLICSFSAEKTIASSRRSCQVKNAEILQVGGGDPTEWTDWTDLGVGLADLVDFAENIPPLEEVLAEAEALTERE